MTQEFCSYEQSLALKELGFDETCFMSYNPNNNFWDNYCTNSQLSSLNGNNSIVCSAPLKQQVFRWFREKHKLTHRINLIDNSRESYYDFIILDSEDRFYMDDDCFDMARAICDKSKFSKYEEAEDACINKLIELVKSKK